MKKYRQKLRALIDHPLRSLALLLYKIGIKRKTSPKKVKTNFGMPINIILPEGVSSKIYLYGNPGDEEIGIFLNKLLRSNDVFIDVGAHIGFYSLLASKLVGRGREVYSFEPTPYTYGILRSNCRQCTNINTSQVAVFSHTSEIEFLDLGASFSAFNSIYRPRLHEAKTYKSIKVKAVSLDQYLKAKKPARIIKIDAEGAEKDVLSGAKTILSEIKPHIIMEVGDFEKKSRECIDFILKYEYQAIEFNKNRFQLHTIRKNYFPSNLFFIHREDKKSLANIITAT